MAIPPINILDELQGEGFHSSVILTYSFDLLFYEHVVWKALKQAGCTNNVVLVDSNCYEEIFTHIGAERVQAGRGYSLVPVSAGSCFHPKIIFLVGRQNIRILIGSGNATLGGYSLNQELFISLTFNLDDREARPLVQSIWTFIHSFVLPSAGSFLAKQLKSIESEVDWLQDTTKAKGRVTQDDVKVSFMVHEQGNSILQQYLRILSGKKVKELIVASPFFDERCNALKSLQKELGPALTQVIFDPESVNLNVSGLKGLKNIEYYQEDFGKSKSYLHAKIYLAKTSVSAHLLIGSANCTNSGLGTLGGLSQNAEACLCLEADDPAFFDDSLHLSRVLTEKNRLDQTKLSLVAYRPDKRTGQKREIRLLGLEYIHGKYHVRLSSISSNTAYNLNMLSTAAGTSVKLSTYESSDDILIFDLGDNHETAYNAGHVLFENGKRTNTLFVSNHLELQRNAPSPRAAKWADIIKELQGEDAEIIDIVEHLDDLLFERPQFQTSSGSHRWGRSAAPDTPTEEETEDQTISYDEFIRLARPSVDPEASLYTSGTDLGPIVAFLLQRFNVIPRKPSTDEIELPTNSSLYTEEIDQPEEAVTGSEEEKEASSKQTEKDKQRAVRSYRNRIRNFARRYIAYLDFLTKGDPSSGIPPPQRLRTQELTKFYICVAIISLYAGKVALGGEEEILEVEGTEDNSYLVLMTTIIWKCFCYYNIKQDHLPVIKKVGIDKELTTLSPDILAFVFMAPFCICSILELFRFEEDDVIRSLEITAYKLYVNLGLGMSTFDETVIAQYFQKFYEKAGFKNHKIIGTNARYLSLDGIISRHLVLRQTARKIQSQLKGIEEKYEKRHSIHRRVRPGDYVWIPRLGLSYVRHTDRTSVSIFDWLVDGKNIMKFKQSDVLRIAI